MNHFVDFDPYAMGQHNRQVRTEADSLRLQRQLLENRKVRRSLRVFAVVKRMARSGNPISPGRRLRTTSPESFVQASLGGRGKTLWTSRGE
jgi:hypothetical protein